MKLRLQFTPLLPIAWFVLALLVGCSAQNLRFPKDETASERLPIMYNSDVSENLQEHREGHHDHRDLQSLASIYIDNFGSSRNNDFPPASPVQGNAGDGYFACGFKVTYNAGNAYFTSLEFKMCSAENWNDQYSLFQGHIASSSSALRMCPEGTYMMGGGVISRGLELDIFSEVRLPSLIDGILIKCRDPENPATDMPPIAFRAPALSPPKGFSWYTITHTTRFFPVDPDNGHRFMRGFQAAYGKEDPGILAGLKLFGEHMPSYSSEQISGRWKSVASGNDVEFSVTVGSSKSDSSSVSQTDSYAFSVSASTGFKFFGLGSKISVSSELASETTEALEETFSYGKSTTVKTSCSGESPTGSWTVWQWTMGQEANEDGFGFSASANHFRCSKSVTEPPRCPLGYCNDVSCFQCNAPFTDLSAETITEPSGDDDSCQRGGLFSRNCK